MAYHSFGMLAKKAWNSVLSSEKSLASNRSLVRALCNACREASPVMWFSGLSFRIYRTSRFEYGIQIYIGVAADSRIARVQRDVDQVFKAGGQAVPGEFTDPRNEAVANVGVAFFDDGLEAAQKVPVGARVLPVLPGR